MIENRLILLLRKSKSLTPKFSASNSTKWKLYSTHSVGNQSKPYCSFARFIPSARTPITRSFTGYGLRSLLQNNFKNFHVPSFRNFSTRKPVNANAGLELLVTARTNAQEAIGIWLFVSAAWVYSMVALGGINRLARFGLSMTDRRFTGRLPLSDDDWLVGFEKYKQSHEYKRMNKEMDLNDFKFIYWMEYAHLLWGRSLGVMFGVPFLYFLSKRYITLRLGLRLCGLFALGAGQGLLEWWMAKSGLDERHSEFAEPRVSFCRLAVHFASTFVVYSGLIWTALSVSMPEWPAESVAWVHQAAKVKRLVLPASFVVGITAIFGAFVAEDGLALDNSPRTIDGWVSKDVFVMKMQFVHQILTAASLFAVGGLWLSMRKLDIPRAVIGIAAVQVISGAAPLFSIAPASLGTLHQAGALTLITLAIYLKHIARRPPSSQLLKVKKTLRSRSHHIYF